MNLLLICHKLYQKHIKNRTSKDGYQIVTEPMMQKGCNKYRSYLFRSVRGFGKIYASQCIKYKYGHYYRREIFFYKKYDVWRFSFDKKQKRKNSCYIVCYSHYRNSQINILISHLSSLSLSKNIPIRAKMIEVKSILFLDTGTKPHMLATAPIIKGESFFICLYCSIANTTNKAVNEKSSPLVSKSVLLPMSAPISVPLTQYD